MIANIQDMLFLHIYLFAIWTDRTYITVYFVLGKPQRVSFMVFKISNYGEESCQRTQKGIKLISEIYSHQIFNLLVHLSKFKLISVKLLDIGKYLTNLNIKLKSIFDFLLTIVF